MDAGPFLDRQFAEGAGAELEVGERQAQRQEREAGGAVAGDEQVGALPFPREPVFPGGDAGFRVDFPVLGRSEEHTSELQSLMRIAYAVFCLKNKTNKRRRYRDSICTNT